MIIVAVDPGEMCGWAVLPIFDNLPWDPTSVAAGQMAADEWCDWCAVNLQPNYLLAVESFTVTTRTVKLSPQPRPVEVIGVMKFLARRVGARLEMQTPAAAKRFVTDAQLRKLGLWKPGQDHARDAIRHLVLATTQFASGRVREELIQSLV